MRSASLGIVLLGCATLAAGCAARVQARVPEAPMPELEAPPAPPRMIVIYEEPVEAPQGPPAGAAPAAPRPPARAPRPDAPSEPALPEATVPEPRPPAPPLTLAPMPGAEAKTEASIRSLLARASQDLARVNLATLSPDGRTQYETARRFLQQADDALKARNLVFAGKLADKAATMSAVLVR